MTKTVGGAGSAVSIGEVAAPPFAHLPDPATLFRKRAQRFAILSEGHELRPYLRFMAGLAEAQHRAQEGLPEPVMPTPDHLARAREHGMPPLNRAHGVGGTGAADEVLAATLDSLFALAPQIDMPPVAREALARVTAASPEAREQMAAMLLLDIVPSEAVAEHVFVAAGLQLHFARMAARLPADRLVPVGEGACPACGARPVSSMVVGWRGAHGTRFCTCSLCSAQWHVVRIKCTLCGTTEGIGFQTIAEGREHLRTETCEACQAHVKVFQQQKEPDVDPVADDVATLALDILMKELGYRRGGANPFLFGY